MEVPVSPILRLVSQTAKRPRYRCADSGNPYRSPGRLFRFAASHYKRRSYAVKYPIRQFSVQKRPAVLRLGNNIFSERGCHLFCQTPELDLKGMLRYGPMSRPAADIMGPFRFIPFMECRHSVFSLAHRVNGHITVNGKCYYFRDAPDIWKATAAAHSPDAIYGRRQTSAEIR